MKRYITEFILILILLISPLKETASAAEPPTIYADPIVQITEVDTLETTLKPLEPRELKTLVKITPKPVFVPKIVAKPAVSGNLYTPGNCTWFAKSRRPDLPNNLGNANTWARRAAAQGYATGSAPRVGAVGVDTSGPLGHVFIVTAVNGTTMTISEMNWRGLYVVSSRTIPASGYSFIY